MAIDIASLTEKGEAVLRDFVTRNRLDGAIVASAEGLEIVSYFTSDLDRDLLAADFASVLAGVEGLLNDSNKGELSEIIVKGENGYLAIVSLGENVVLGVLAPTGQKLGVLIIAMQQLVKKLKSL
ncbi:roadblock/LC7 domain-containing protein [Thermovibrio ammonificans]|jgi:predicted regulator of Ras-like GTPase activity (Roadblock/LC7/MglB family)|uniref:Roadblock/LC7 family protein n=1 Tax=Thermovibrio ammonificans (strain DSM 15698 / JCM 12110 / HB-1) TaxID=648996 RepID=E8T5U8_THEA1|nr:roadblock/LC7 domain-containing protein [Thermovibrio ammonificans]ADU97674.1 Roadblock/LC7 family protein [Thermovibrio ammonificans HB-1]